MSQIYHKTSKIDNKEIATPDLPDHIILTHPSFSSEITFQKKTITPYKTQSGFYIDLIIKEKQVYHLLTEEYKKILLKFPNTSLLDIISELLDTYKSLIEIHQLKLKEINSFLEFSDEVINF